MLMLVVRWGTTLALTSPFRLVFSVSIATMWETDTKKRFHIYIYIYLLQCTLSFCGGPRLMGLFSTRLLASSFALPACIVYRPPRWGDHDKHTMVLGTEWFLFHPHNIFIVVVFHGRFFFLSFSFLLHDSMMVGYTTNTVEWLTKNSRCLEWRI